MNQPPSQEITRLLVAWGEGDKHALDRLMPFVYEELKRLARSYMRNQRKGHTLQTTALVNEAYLRLVNSDGVKWQDRSHFYAISANVMRRILVDFARARQSRKRGGDQLRVTFDEGLQRGDGRGTDLLALDEALGRLSGLDERQSKVVELKYFGGLTEDEAAHVLGISARTVRREWSVARAWLYRELSS